MGRFFLFYLALWLGKLTSFLSRFSGTGAGSTWPGHLALKIFPPILQALESRLPLGSVLISGTNGKTTTAALLAEILKTADFAAIHNTAGANLLNGLTSALLNETDWRGRPLSRLGVFEIDEGSLPYVLSLLSPEIVVLLNLSRDQLDRYGEIDLTLFKWRQALLALPQKPAIILKKDDLYLRQLQPVLSQAGFPLHFFSRGEPSGFPSPLPGSFNQANTNAAVAAAQLLGVAEERIREGLKGFPPVFGRGEELWVEGRRVTILLSKNPASFNENLDLLRESTHSPTLLLALNDNIPDGRDVSWIYDVDFEKHRDWLFRSPLFVSGKRALDLALRLKYAELPLPLTPFRLSAELKEILPVALGQPPPGETLYILPTYSAMLEVRRILTGRALL